MKTLALLIATLFYLNATAQKVVKEYYDLMQTRVKFEYQVDNSTGVKNGYYKAFGTKGNLAEEGTYKMNRKTGTWTQYDEYGKPFSIANYVDDNIHGVYKQWCFEDYKTVSYLCGDYIYNKGKEETALQYYPNGQLSKKVVPNGVCNEWYENGKKKSEWTNTNGISGGMTYFLDDGRPEVETKNGKTYTYSGDGYSDKGDSRYDNYGSLKSVDFDSAGFHYKYKYNESVSKNYLTSITKSALSGNKKEVTNYTPKGQITDVTVYEGERKIDETLYDNGKLWKTITKKDNNINSIVNYHENGKKRQEYSENAKGERVGYGIEYYEDGTKSVEEDFDKGYHREYYPSGKISFEYGFRTSKENRGEKCCFFREYYESGKLKSEVLTDEPGYFMGQPSDTTRLSGKQVFYDETGVIKKIDVVNTYSGQVTNTITNPQDISDFMMGRYDKIFQFLSSEYQAAFNGNGQYPKGELFYSKTSSVLDDITKRYLKATSADEKKSLLLEYEKAVAKINSIAGTNLTQISEQLKTAKKPEDIKKILGL